MKNSEQSAFPIPCEKAIGTGLTKREYFAGVAMVGLLSNPETTMDKEGTARLAIEQADELIKQLNG